MDMRQTHMTLKYIKIISVIALSFYALLPFINGLGCNYKSETVNENIIYLTSCKLGIVESIAWNKRNGEKKIFKGFLAKKDSSIIFFVTHSQELEKPIYEFNHGLNIRFSDATIWSAKLIHTKEHDIVLVGNPSYQIYITNISGKLAFW